MIDKSMISSLEMLYVKASVKVYWSETPLYKVWVQLGDEISLNFSDIFRSSFFKIGKALISIK